MLERALERLIVSDCTCILYRLLLLTSGLDFSS
jgi:hypothetical protein